MFRDAGLVVGLELQGVGAGSAVPWVFRFRE